MLRRSLLVALASLFVLAVAGEIGNTPPVVHAASNLNFVQACPGGGLGEQDFFVPGGVTAMRVTLNGAQGGPGFASAGGAGATVSAMFTVTAGTQYFLDLGCAGMTTAGGWNGGGDAGPGAGNEVGGGGGGASVLRSSSCALLPNPCPNVAAGALLVAGGGGGGGGNGGPAVGGAGGGHIPASPNGQDGANGADGGGNGGGGATPAAPGTATISNGSTAGDPAGIVGRGGTGSTGGIGGSGAGGGGGGGCHGGGGGASSVEASGGGGGGGSSCAAAGATNVFYLVSATVDGTALVEFISPPVLTKSFTDASILSGGITTMVITLDNDNPGPITNVSFIDNLAAAGIQIAATPGFTENCIVGTFSGFTAGSTLVSVSGVGLTGDGSATETCTITVDVTSSTLGQRTNTIASVSSNETGSGPGATASFTVVVPDTIDLIATKTSSAAPQANVPFTWTVQIRNQGTGTANFTNGATVFTDNLPTTNISYAPMVTVANQVGIVGTVTCTIVVADVSCTGFGLPFGISAGGGFDVIITATATTTGAFTNPRGGGICMADPGNLVAETNGQINAEANNTCSNTAHVGVAQAPDLTISKTHTGNFTQGQTGATFTVTVTNSGNVATSGAVNVADVLPAGLTATAIAGPGWTCTLAPLSCTRADALAPAASYPPITLTVNVASNAATSLSNVATVSGGNEPAFNNGNNTATDPVTVIAVSVDLTITKTHAGNFTQGQTGATFTITVTNSGTVATTGAVNVTDVLPAGLTATAIAGTGWTCTLAPLACTRADALAPAASYPPITLTVNVASSAPASMNNVAMVSGGNEPAANSGNNTATDPVTIGGGGADLALTKTGGTGTLTPGANVTYTLSLRNNGPAPATNVLLSDPIPVNTTFVSATADPGFTMNAPAAGSGPPATVTFTAATLAVNATATFTMTVRVNPAATGMVVNTAAATNSVLDSNTANNTATVQGTLGVVAAATTTPTATPTATPTVTPTATASPFVPPVIPQVFQNQAIQGIFAPGNRSTPTPRPAAVAPSSSSGQPTNLGPQPIFRPPSTGDAGLLRLPNLW